MKHLHGLLLYQIASYAVCTGATPHSNVTVQLNEFAAQFWQWRSQTAPITSDDLPRTAVDRPLNWAPNCSYAAFIEQMIRYEGFVTQLKLIRTKFETWTVEDQSDYYGLSSALARVYWELHIFTPHFRDPSVYLQLSFGSIWDLLVSIRPPTMWNESNVVHQLLPRMRAIPRILDDGLLNLKNGNPTQAYAQLFLQNIGYNTTSHDQPLLLSDVLQKAMHAIVTAAQPPLSDSVVSQLAQAANDSGPALSKFAQFVATERSTWSTNSSIGTANYLWFLRHVSFVNYTTTELVDMGRQQLAFADAMLEMETMKNNAADVGPPLPIHKSLEDQINATRASSRKVRMFLEQTKLFRFPEWFGADAEYTVAPIPPWLAPFGYCTHDQTDCVTQRTSPCMYHPLYVRSSAW